MNVNEIIFFAIPIIPWVLFFIACLIIRKNERELRDTRDCALSQLAELKEKHKGIISIDI